MIVVIGIVNTCTGMCAYGSDDVCLLCMPVLLRVQHAHKHHTNYHILLQLQIIENAYHYMIVAVAKKLLMLSLFLVEWRSMRKGSSVAF